MGKSDCTKMLNIYKKKNSKILIFVILNLKTRFFEKIKHFEVFDHNLGTKEVLLTFLKSTFLLSMQKHSL